MNGPPAMPDAADAVIQYIMDHRLGHDVGWTNTSKPQTQWRYRLRIDLPTGGTFSVSGRIDSCYEAAAVALGIATPGAVAS